MKFKDMPIGHTFTNSESVLMKVQPVVAELEKDRSTIDGYPLRFNAVCIGGVHGINGILIWFDEELDFN